MSENEDENQNQEKKDETTNINVTLDRSPELEQLQKQLDSEREEKAKYQTLAENLSVKDFEKRCRAVGLDPQEYAGRPEVLKAVEDLKKIDEQVGTRKAPVGGQTQTWQQNVGNENFYEPTKPETLDAINTVTHDCPISICKWSSEASMIEGLTKISRNTEDPRQEEARRYLTQLTNKIILQKNQEMELDTPLTELGKLEKNRRKMVWKKVEDGE